LSRDFAEFRQPPEGDASGGREPGTYQWCPNATLSYPVTGPPNGGARNGRVIYLAGANRFGGTMQIGGHR